MRDSNNKKIIKRESFKNLDWVCKSIFLNFKIYDDFTVVESKLYFNKNKITGGSNLQLNGFQLNTIKFKILYIFNNKKNLVESLSPISDDLIIKVPSNCYKVIIKSSVKLNPKLNSSLEGFYGQILCFVLNVNPKVSER